MAGIFSGKLVFGGAYLSEGILCFKIQCRLDLTIKQLKHEVDSLNQLKTANPMSSWDDIWEDLLSEGYLRLRFEGPIFGRAYFWRGLLFEFYSISDMRKHVSPGYLCPRRES